jgi:hypothetical protein
LNSPRWQFPATTLAAPGAYHGGDDIARQDLKVDPDVRIGKINRQGCIVVLNDGSKQEWPPTFQAQVKA